MNEFIRLVLNDYSISQWLFFYFLFAIGYSFSHYRSVKRGVKKNEQYEKFNFNYWYRNNVVPILIDVAVLYLWILFADQIIIILNESGYITQFEGVVNIIFGSKATLAFLVGLLYKFLGINGVKKIITFFQNKFSKKK